MLETSGVGYPEQDDAISASALARFATEADSRIMGMLGSVSTARYPDCAILRPSATSGPWSGNFNVIVDFNTVVYSSRGPAGGVGLPVGSSRAGRYLVGGTVLWLTSGSVSSTRAELNMTEYRGTRTVNVYRESLSALTAKGPRGAEYASVATVLDMYDPTKVSASLSVVGLAGGSITVQTSSRIWMVRVRDL